MVSKAAVVTKIQYQELSLPENQKLTHADVNEIKRVTDDLVDLLVYGGLYTCEGTGSQNLATASKITINQWQDIQAESVFDSTAGDQSITIPSSGVYLIEVLNLSYETTARNGEIFKFRLLINGDPVPGACTRVQHQHAATTTYSCALGRILALDEDDVITVEVESLTLASTRTFALRHGSLMAYRLNG